MYLHNYSLYIFWWLFSVAFVLAGILSFVIYASRGQFAGRSIGWSIVFGLILYADAGPTIGGLLAGHFAQAVCLGTISGLVYMGIMHDKRKPPHFDEYKKTDKRLWKIDGKYYDLTIDNFLDRHPGGREILLISRTYHADQTYAFESQHANFRLVRSMLKKFEVDPPEDEIIPDGPDGGPRLCAETSFYSVLRDRVCEYIREHGKEPAPQAMALFYTMLVLWFASWGAMYSTGSTRWCIANAMVGSILGGFGHSWIHQPKYRAHAYVMDLIGFSSQNWYESHVLQHHLYTNTTGDNHWEGTSPFLIPDPTKEKYFWHHFFSIPMFFIVLAFGVPGNNLGHTAELLRGREMWSWAKLIVPVQLYMMYTSWGIYGLGLIFLNQALCGIYYFTVALANHNAEFCLDFDEINNARDWGEQQILVSGDIHTGIGYYNSMTFLWLNYHCVHHLFPTVDQWHHPAIQKILITTCEEFDIQYRCWSLSQLFVSMMRTFSGSSTKYVGKPEALPNFPVNGFKKNGRRTRSPTKAPTMDPTRPQALQ